MADSVNRTLLSLDC